MNDYLKDAPLGQSTPYVCHYDPDQLFAIPRSNSWQTRGHATAPFQGCDIWNAYELSWLNPRGLPQVAMAEIRVPCESPFIIESKSFKLYLNSFNLSRFDTIETVHQHMVEDLSQVAGAPVSVSMRSVDEQACIAQLDGECLDQLDVAIEHYEPAPRLLQTTPGDVIRQTLYSHLLKSNCPVTGQPDWASIRIDCLSAPLDREGLLKYLVSYREHGDFHEQCVEQIFLDILENCQPRQLSVHARYVRRGGLDINPYRSTTAESAVNSRLSRQ
ncbi:NADPH-dependent 7-cyano-7-deazaguanine reductase QueF [Granulosicoccus sp. 3-233]|uniref:NADPH-dependent 7-cyano-7-deazaguanine reductase QueF n=1 Tax=Granulosicoccus sp. 3-233 TaxID=3417969 RepID=UPI003D335105